MLINRKFAYIFVGIINGQQRRSFGILERFHQKWTQVQGEERSSLSRIS